MLDQIHVFEVEKSKNEYKEIEGFEIQRSSTLVHISHWFFVEAMIEGIEKSFIEITSSDVEPNDTFFYVAKDVIKNCICIEDHEKALYSLQIAQRLYLRLADARVSPQLLKFTKSVLSDVFHTKTDSTFPWLA